VTSQLKRPSGWWLSLLIPFGALMAVGCQHTPINTAEGPAPLRRPRPPEDSDSYENSLNGGEVFAMYCNQCHNARSLGERPFSNYQNVAAHMRVRATLTGVEYEKVLEFLRRWHDLPPVNPPVDPSPKRLIPGQPIAELLGEIGPAEVVDAREPKSAAPATAPIAAEAQPAVPGPAALPGR
jgi:hypothetical protein